jgi:DnaJ-class molecular chaperone
LDESRHVDLYTVLGVSADATEAILKRAYRLRSLKYHPDKKTGSTFAFQRVRTAYETLSDPEKRRAHDLGQDIEKPPKNDDSDSEYSDDEKVSLREEIERKYWPERYEFLPFGDPFAAKRKLRAKRARNAGGHRTAW